MDASRSLLLVKALALLVWGITPASWIIVVLALLRHALMTAGFTRTTHTIFSRSRLLEHLVTARRPLVIAFAEVIFSIYHHGRVKSIQAPVRRNRPSTDRIVTVFENVLRDGLGRNPKEQDEALNELIERYPDGTQMPKVKKPLEKDDPRARKFRNTFGLWFFGLKEEHITRADMREWISWALCGRHANEIQDAESQSEAGRLAHLVETGLSLVEARRGERFPECSVLSSTEQKDHRMMLISLDPVRVESRPLVYYLLIKAMNVVLLQYLKIAYGVEVLKCGRIHYLYYNPPTWSRSEADAGKQSLPLVFIHGLGVGLLQYAWLLFKILGPASKPYNRPFIAPIQPWITHELFSSEFLTPWDAIEASETIRAIVRRHDFTRINVLSHSKGTVAHAWIIKRLGDAVVRSCFVDPVCFELWAPHLCYRFLYKQPETWIEYGLRYFVARELGIAYTLLRHFEWSENVLLPNVEMPKANDPAATRFYIAGADSVFDAPHVRDYLQRNGITKSVHFYEDQPHGALIMAPNPCTPNYISWLDEYVAT